MMPFTGYEAGGFRDHTRIADAMEKIADNTAQIAFVLDGIYTELIALNQLTIDGRLEEKGDTPKTAGEKAKRASEIVNKAKEAFGHV